MRKQIYTQAYFLIQNNHNYSHSFGVRMKYVGLNTLIGVYAAARYYFNALRLKSANGETTFD
ncbi:unnamed protein product [Paramecium primaurelia]|uniref:Uncharacterized protein n=2 Tax=Paramecium TaxID=5884 RepID=A0A8S1L2I5_PARPR|nr:unnamed protein product [Paramecium primaurelia]CAD8075343.1 unnamed protein product [Paramecium primaurelia]CAD8161372.1 unnamed protein product [Paramecium pentaurelia]CAD8168494.1 unnamed protein product [Paramecium pentaurelia]